MLYYSEIFTSIQGEGYDSGLPTTFVRLYGCNLNCSYCDSPQSSMKAKRYSVKNIVEEVVSRKVKNVCITGGEPLIQGETIPLVYELLARGFRVAIETNGAIAIDPDPYVRSFKYVMDIKSPSSGESHHNVYANLGVLQGHDELKFVIGDRNDYEFAKKVLEDFPTKARILMSPIFVGNKPTLSKDLVQWILEDGIDCKVMIQIHKILLVQ